MKANSKERKAIWLGGGFRAWGRLGLADGLTMALFGGGKLRAVEIDESHLRVADLVRPKICEDGMFFVGLDIVGDKLMKINVFRPGGLGSAQKFEHVNFNHAVVDALERKVTLMQAYARRFSNVEMATL